jgi:alpha-tubulin suppressor-like RCC1 family protein
MVKNASSQPVAGAAVSFSGPVGASFTPVSATTNGSGAAVTQLDLGTPWAKPGSVVSVSAVSGSDASSASFTVLGSNLVVAGAGYSAVLAQSELVFSSPVVDAVAAGLSNPWFMVLLANGTVWTKGDNGRGQLGDGSTSARSTWAPVPGLSGVRQIAAGASTGYAVLSDGSVRAWGLNEVGQLGDGSTTDRVTPVPVSGLTSGVTQIAAGDYTGFAVLSDGSVRAWGLNALGQVGDGSTTDRWTPTLVSGLSGAKQVAAGVHTGFALLSDGSVRAWGFNGLGQLGDGSTDDQLTPVPVSGLTSGVTQIAAGVHTGYALLSGGSVRAWGFNALGQVGDGSTTDRLTPVQVSGLTSGVTQIATANNTAYALLSDGSVRAWGFNSVGQVGDGSTTERHAPVSVGLPVGRIAQRLGTNSKSSYAAMIVMKSD